MATRKPMVVGAYDNPREIASGDTIDPTYLPAGIGAETTTTIGALINGATAKTTPVDADMFGLMDSAASNILKKFSWANIKTMLDAIYYKIGGTDVAIADGGTGASTAANARINLQIQTLFADTTDRQPAGTTQEDMQTLTIDAPTLSTNKMAIVSEWSIIMVASITRKQHQITFNGTTVASVDSDVIESTGAVLRLRIVRESNTVVRCFSDAAITGVTRSTNPRYTRITGLNLTTTGYDIVYKIRNYTTATDSTLHTYSVWLTPAP